MIDIFEDMPEKLKDSIIELLIARREDTYHGILDIDKKYSKSKDIIEKHIEHLREKDPSAADTLENAIAYIEERITLNLYNKGFKDGQELHLLVNSTVQING